MTLYFDAAIKMNASQAKAEAKALAKDMEAATTEARQIGTAGGQAAGGLNALGAAASKTEAHVAAMARAETTAAATAVKLGQANKSAAGNMGNLVAQFNDIGLMMAAGQNPLQLALQQGTQISQVIGPMGAAGAVRALGGAFIGMLNPISLITIGSIAAGAAMTQWLTRAKEEALTLEDAVSNLDKSLKDYQGAAEQAATPTRALREEWGGQATEIRAVYAALEDLTRLDALGAVGGVRSSLLQQFDGLERRLGSFEAALKQVRGGTDNVRNAAAGMSRTLQKEFGLSIDQARAMKQALEQLDDAQGPKDTADALAQIREIMIEVARSGAKLPENFIATAREIADAELKARNLADSIGENSRIAETLRGVLDALSFDNAIGGAQSLLGWLDKAFSRAVNLQQMMAEVAGRQISRDQKITLQNTEIEARRRGASEPEVAGLVAGQKEQFLLQNKGIPPELMQKAVDNAVKDAQVLAANSKVLADLKTPAKSSGSAGGTKKEADALARLIQQQELQIAILRETDPVQKEMLKNRTALAGATDAERAAVQSLIAQRQAEQQSLTDLQNQREAFTSTTYDALEGLGFEGKSLIETFDNLGQAIAKAAFQAAMLGTGPLAGILGTSGGSGLIGAVAEAIIPGRAEGGLIYGPGSSVSDSIYMTTPSGAPVRASNAEFMVNAKATARNRHLLELINAGAEIPGYATGGLVANQPGAPMPDNLRDREHGRQSGTQINHFHITTNDAHSFMRSRAGVARRGHQLVASAGRVS